LPQWDAHLLARGHFSLCSFGFLSLIDFKPIETPFGIRIARPEMMAMANLLYRLL
jgi:hypothetical protein